MVVNHVSGGESSRELIGKIPTRDPNITEVVYLAEIVLCLECQQTVPMGIEVVTVKKSGKSKQVVRQVCYCRGHGFDYETKAQSLRFAPMLDPKNRCSVSGIQPGA